MNNASGIAIMNHHHTTGTLNASREVTLPTLWDDVVCVKYGNDLLQYTVDEGTLTITNEERSEGDEVDIFLFCMSKTEKGGMCERVPDSAKEAKLQAYYDLL